MIEVKNKYEGNIVYFRFYASEKYPLCFWYTHTSEAFGFNLGKTSDYIPINTTWKEINETTRP